MNGLKRLAITIGVLACAMPAPAQDGQRGWYAVAAAGSTDYDYSYGFFEERSASATGWKLGVGHRFGVFALEAWFNDFGRAEILGGGTMRTHSIAVNGAWYFDATPGVHVFVRAGGAEFTERRSDRPTQNQFRFTGGVGVAVDVTRPLGLEIAVETTEAVLSGRVILVSLGARWRF